MSDNQNQYILNRDILINHVFPHLSLQDIYNVSLTSRDMHDTVDSPAVWHDLYLRTFGENPLTDRKWPEIYKIRSRSGLFTWGHNGRGKLGLNITEVPHAVTTRQGVSRPTQVRGLGSMILSDISAGGWGFILLDIEGSVYGIGSLSDRGRAPFIPRSENHPLYPSTRAPRCLRPVGGRGPFPFRIGGLRRPDIPPVETENPPPPEPISRPNQPTSTAGMYSGDNQEPQTEVPFPLGHGFGAAVPPRTTEEANAFLNAAEDNTSDQKLTDKDIRDQWLLKFPDNLHPKILVISAGRSRALALDEDNNIWQWDRSFYDPADRLEFAFGNKSIIRIEGGWEKAVALVQDVGLVVWNEVSRGPGWVQKVDHVTIPETNLEGSDRIVDVAVGRDSIVFIDKKGAAFVVDINNLQKGATPLAGFMNKLKLSNWQVLPKFVKVSGNLDHFALISDRENVFLTPPHVTLDATTKPLIIPELQNKGCISVAAADHHFLALLRGGKILSWGRESLECGDLGHGQGQDLLELDGASQSGVDIVLSKPTEIKFDGYALAIAAGGWQSAAIITTDPVTEDQSSTK